MMHLGISFVSGLNILEKYLNESRLRLIRNIRVKSALAAVKLLRKVYLQGRTPVNVGVCWIGTRTRLEISLVALWVR